MNIVFLNFRILLVFISITYSASLIAQDHLFNRLYDYMQQWQIVASLAETEDGYVIAIKNAAQTYEDNRIILVGLNMAGDTLWTKHHFTDSTVVHFTSYNIEMSDDNNFILAGTIDNPQLEPSNADAIMIKVDSNGEKIWQKTYGGIENNGIRSFEKTPDDGFILGGYSRNEDESGDFYLIKTDPEGDMEWETHLGGIGYQSGYSVDFTPDGGYVISGRAGDPPFDVDIAVAKCDSLGNQLWYRVFGGTYNNDAPHSLVQLSDGNILIAGAMGNGSVSADINRDAYLIKIDQEGDILWEKIYDEEYTTVHASNIIELSDGSVVVAGIRYPNNDDAHNSTLSKFDKSGELIWRNIYTNPNPEASTYLYNISLASDGGFLAYGSAYDPNFDNYQEGWLIKTDSEGYACETVNCVVVEVEEVPLTIESPLNIFPNPTSGSFTIEWEGEDDVLSHIYSSGGVRIWSNTLNKGNTQVDLRRYPTGMYFIQVIGEFTHYQRRVVLTR